MSNKKDSAQVEQGMPETSPGLGTADIPPLEGEHIPAADADESIHPDAAGAGQQAESGFNTGELVASLLMIGHGVAAKRLGKHWELSPDEALELGNATGAVLDKYFPDLSVGPEVKLIVVGLAVYGPRWAMHAAIRDEQKKTEKAKTFTPEHEKPVS